ncbi:MAG: radical SAM protein [Pseudomonadota bacterium]
MKSEHASDSRNTLQSESGSPGCQDSAVRPASVLPWRAEDAVVRPLPEEVFEAGLRQHHLANTAYPIAHRTTIWQHRVDEDQYAPILRQALEASPSMSLYAHVPFCERRCSFCEYTVLDRHVPQDEERYMAALLRELDLYLDLLGRGQHTLAGFDIGGGTPSLVQPRHIATLVERVHGGFRLGEGYGISIETTPKIAALCPDTLRAFKIAGIHRISMGLQMANPRLLREYGRDLNDVTFNRRAVDNIRTAGFESFNIDVMYGFAKQTVEDVLATLRHTLALDPEVITLYRMRYKGTKVRGEASDIPLERVMAMYLAARALLAEHGYHANPGKNGFSRVAGDPGTSAYLTERVVHGGPYLGLGLGAQTFTNNALGYNLGAASKRLDGYLDAVDARRLPIQDLYWLPRSEAMAKMVSVAFYFGEIHRPSFAARFGQTLEQAFPAVLGFVQERGLMESRGDCLALTEHGAQHFNGVIALFYSAQVQQHLLSL